MERPPPPQGQPPPYAFVARVYKRSLRPVVIGCCAVAAGWAGIWAISGLINAAGRYKIVNIILGALYLVIAAIEAFAIVAAWKQSIPMVRIYTFLSVAAAIIIFGAELTRVIVYFVGKNNLITDCSQETEGLTISGWGSWWGNDRLSTTLTGPQALAWCQERWNRGVWGNIVWLIIASSLAWLFASTAFSYYHQLLAPQTIAPSQAFQMNAYRQQGPYNPQGGYQYPARQQEDYVPAYDPHKVPDYDGPSGGHMPPLEKESDLGNGMPTGLGYTNSGGANTNPFTSRPAP